MSQNKGFRHYRNILPHGSAVHEINNKGGVTLAFASPRHINDLTAEDQVSIAFSFCSADDNFERSVGRAEADLRLNGQPGLTIPGDQFQRLLHAPTVRDLLIHDILPGLDQEQSIAFRSKVKRSGGRK